MPRSAPPDPDTLLPLVYDELRRIARSFLDGGADTATVQPTALVHEAWMRIARRPGAAFDDRAHFLGTAARAMRNLLVDLARARASEKRGGDRERMPLEVALELFDERAVDLVLLDDALDRLAEEDGQLAAVVELRFFGGLTHDEVAGVLGLSVPTVERRWRSARAWLRLTLADEAADGSQAG